MGETRNEKREERRINYGAASLDNAPIVPRLPSFGENTCLSTGWLLEQGGC